MTLTLKLSTRSQAHPTQCGECAGFAGPNHDNVVCAVCLTRTHRGCLQAQCGHCGHSEFLVSPALGALHDRVKPSSQDRHFLEKLFWHMVCGLGPWALMILYIFLLSYLN